ncbi:protein-export chaperone SecB, partial [uncultured Mucilaginibacter sp.]|uniref:protein-export chaperone SecB n=1 Tax=uncultured Mucilaginibacter sp. TaxID=797541 RepID=UPI0025EBC0D4
DNEEIVLDVTPSIFLHKESKDSFEIIMSVNVSAEGSFVIETNAVGAFTIGEDASEEYRKIFMNVNSPAIMFPYVRAFLSTITASFGTNATGTITIPALTFTGELDIINPDSDVVTSS